MLTRSLLLLLLLQLSLIVSLLTDLTTAPPSMLTSRLTCLDRVLRSEARLICPLYHKSPTFSAILCSRYATTGSRRIGPGGFLVPPIRSRTIGSRFNRPDYTPAGLCPGIL